MNNYIYYNQQIDDIIEELEIFFISRAKNREEVIKIRHRMDALREEAKSEFSKVGAKELYRSALKKLFPEKAILQ